MKLKELLAKKLTKKEIAILPSSFDVVGDIMLFIDFPSGLAKKEKMIANEILANFKNIKVVCKKIKKYSGKFRLPKFKIIAGEKRKETEHKENGIRLRLNVEKVYFSPRTSSERKRINNIVEEGESVLVMFSGCGPYVVNISKNTAAKEVYGIEINPSAHNYAMQNVSLNKCKNVKLFFGDVRKIAPKLKKKFDRVIMPLPKDAQTFLDVALSCLKKKGIIHLYLFLEEEKINKKYLSLFLSGCITKEFKIADIVKCGQYGPRIFRTCVDIIV